MSHRSQQPLFTHTSGAVVSRCRKYRYRLTRIVQSSRGTIAYFGVNPSTADALVDDATVRKWTGFTRQHGFGRFLVGNAFAWRVCNVKELGHVADPIGPGNDRHLRQIIETADLLVPCWGSRLKLPVRLRAELDHLFTKLKSSGKPVAVFGVTRHGDPLHPLMLPYGTQLVHLDTGRSTFTQARVSSYGRRPH